MERKFLLYREAGVREYWIVDPESGKLKVHCFRNGEIITNVYTNTDVVPVVVLPGFSVALEPVFME